jgi:hypothetical protein
MVLPVGTETDDIPLMSLIAFLYPCLIESEDVDLVIVYSTDPSRQLSVMEREGECGRGRTFLWICSIIIQQPPDFTSIDITR